MKLQFLRILLLIAAICWVQITGAQQRKHKYIEDTPRIAVMSAFAPELSLLLEQVQKPEKYTINGVEFTLGQLAGKDVVLLLSGISMVNAAMNTQLLFDNFNISHLVFSGIAGGVNPSLNLGDVSVPSQWGQYLELVMMRENADGSFQAPKGKSKADYAAFGMMQPRPVRVRSNLKPEIHEKFWFAVDAKMLAAAKNISAIDLQSCDNKNNCVAQQPRLVVGGNGVSGQAFVDNAKFRQYAYDTFAANVLDMESAACAMVAYSNGIPFLAFRSLSDLAGGGKGENEMYAFMNIAAANASAVLLKFLQVFAIDE